MRRLAACLLLALPGLCQETAFVIQDATIHPVTSPELTGSVLVEDGVITGIGDKIRIPKGIRVIDARGLHLWPGMIDSATTLGLTEIASVRETLDTTEIGQFNPQLRAIIAVNPASEHIPVTRANGITSAITMPEGGVLAGQAALIHLDGWTWQEMEVQSPAALHLRFPVIGGGGRGGRGGFAEAKRRHDELLRDLHGFFEDARRYQKAKAAGAPGFQTDLKYEAMLPVLDRTLPVVVTAAREREIREALEFAATEEIRIILAGVREPGAALEEIKTQKIPVIVPADNPLAAPPLEEDDPYDKMFSLPGLFYKEGIQFAFGTFGDQFCRNLPYQAAAAVPFGLPQAEALKAVTIGAARIWGVDDKLGSIEEGKWADLVLTDGDLLEARTSIKREWIRGKEVSLDNRQTELYEKYLNRP